MADKRIEDFATLNEVEKEDLLLVSSEDETYNTTVEALAKTINSLVPNNAINYDHLSGAVRVLLDAINETRWKQNSNKDILFRVGSTGAALEFNSTEETLTIEYEVGGEVQTKTVDIRDTDFWRDETGEITFQAGKVEDGNYLQLESNGQVHMSSNIAGDTQKENFTIPKMEVSDPYGEEGAQGAVSILHGPSGIKVCLDMNAGALVVYDTKIAGGSSILKSYSLVELSESNTVAELGASPHVIITQTETSSDGEVSVDKIKRIPLDKFISEISDSLNLVKDMEEVENGIKITFNDGQEVCIPNGCGGLVFDENTKELSLLDSKGEVLGDTVPIIAGIDGLNMEIETDSDDESKKYLVLLDSGMNELARTQLPAMGGGTVSGTQMRLRNALPSTSFTVPYNETDGCNCELKFTFTSVDSDGYGTGSGTATYLVGGAEKLKQQNLPQGENSIDIGPYLTVGKTNTVKVIVEDAEGNKKTLTYNITVSHNYISSTFPLISKQNGNFTVPFTAVGSGTKTVHFLIDGEEIGTEENPPSSRERYKEIEALSHGSHTLEIYMTTILEGYTDEIRSNTLKFGIVAIEEGNTQPVFLMMSSSSEVLQYSNIETQFLLHDPLKGKCDVVCSVDGEPVTTLSVNDDVNVWNYRIMTAGEHTLSMAYDRGTEDASDDISVSTVVNATIVDVAKAETAGLKFHFNAANRSNNEPNPAFYEYTNSDGETYSMKFNNMNFINDGWTGKSLNIGVGSSVEINCSPFADDVTSTTGKTLEFYFKAKNVYNYNSLVISCFANSKGIQITPNSGALALNSENALDIQYKDEKDIKISFVISRRNSENEGQMQLVYIYVDSCIAGVLKYSTADSFSQIDKPCITIGSNEAGIELYNVRYYDVDLSSYQILDNFIADTPDPLEMLERNKRNDIFDQNNQVDPDKLHEDCPYLIVSCPRLPDYKGDVIKGVSGRFVDKLHPERSFTFKDAEMDVQGTSSAGYKVKNFKIKYKGGFIIIGINGEDNTVVGYSIFGEDVDVPVSVFCYKADVASSEGANNVVLVKIWEEMVPYKTPPQQAEYDEKGYNTIRQTINGRAIVLFWENSDTGAISFRGKYNFNNDKSTAETFGFIDDADHNCQCWEFKDNGLELTEFRGDDFDSLNANGKPVWTDAFEARFPDKFEDTTKLRRVVSWVASTDTTKATGNTLSRTYTDIDGKAHTKDTAEYRLAKFKTEFEDYFVKIPVLFYYWFTGLFLMVDSRAKNQFITTWDGIHWLFLPYDADTALGTNNMGALKFGYWLEDTDQVNGADVYNGQISVLWKNVNAVFSEDISNIAQEAVSAGLTYEYVRDMFNKHQKPWSEAIFCADTVVKYIDPYIETGSEDYLDKAQGNKEAQRDNWLFNRFNFFNSKHHTGSARENFITLRMAEPHGDTVDYVGLDMNLHITPYTHLYAGVNYGQALQLERAYPEEEVTFVSPLDRPSDSPVYIYSADQLKDIGDLSPLYPTHVDVGAAVNLEKLIVGNPTIGYRNEGLISLGIKNNSKLKIVDIRNCVNLTGSITAGECENIEEIYADNTRITSVTLPVGGKLKTMRLPNTIENITVRKHKLIQELYIAGYDNIKTLYVDECPTIDVMDILQKAQNLTHVRLTDVEWNLPDTSLLDRLLALGGVPENAEGTTAQSYLSGSVHVPQINTAQLNAYRQAWKDLDISYDTFIPQYPVTYVNADDSNTVLYTRYVDQGSPVPDPYAEGWIEKPTKDSDAQYDYSFGSETDGVYNVGSGWDCVGSTVLAPITVTAVYASTVRKYTVTWWSRPGVSLGSVEAEYGSEVVYSGDTPVNTSGESVLVYSVFAGWNKSTGYIREDTDVYAIWETSSLPPEGKDIKDMTPGEIFAVTTSGRTEEYLTMKDYVDITLGHDFAFENVESEVIAENLYLDGQTAIDKQITLFGENDRSFTLAIDYQFTGTEKGDTLVSCFEEDGSEGFRLCYNGNPEIQWGDASQKFGSGKLRDIVVLRHIKGDDTLYVYASNSTTSSSMFDMSISAFRIARSRTTTTDQILTLGAVRYKGDGGHDYYGHGHIHWCKIWYDDLGDANARQLAAWYREPIRMEYYGTELYRLSGGTSQKTNASFICNHLLEGRGQQMNTRNTNAGGWDATKARTFMNTRVRAAFPTVWQSMLKQIRVTASAGSGSTDIITSDDYVYLPCLNEISKQTNVTYVAEGDYISWYTSNLSRIKFRGYKITDGAEYYTTEQEPSTYLENDVKEGDVWAKSGVGYIYVTQQHLDEYGITPEYTASIGGGWIDASRWCLRSPSANSSLYFWSATKDGTTYDYSSTGAVSVFDVCPCFSI